MCPQFGQFYKKVVLRLSEYGDVIETQTIRFVPKTFFYETQFLPADYKELFPIFVFDVSKQSGKLKNSVTDMQIKAQFSENMRENTRSLHGCYK